MRSRTLKFPPLATTVPALTGEPSPQLIEEPRKSVACTGGVREKRPDDFVDELVAWHLGDALPDDPVIAFANTTAVEVAVAAVWPSETRAIVTVTV